MKRGSTCRVTILLGFVCFIGALGAADVAAPADMDSPIGFAMVNGETTGGGDAAPIEVTTFAELKAAVQDSQPRVIHISGTIKTTDESGWPLDISGNKTILGVNKDATIYGGIAIKNTSNVIVRHLNIHGTWPDPGPGDTVAVRESDHVWLNHLNIWDAGDGNLDITRESSYVTVSWCKFWYTDESHDHRLNGLIGSGGGDHPEDWGKLKVTYHHNWFGEFVDQRMPRVMYGQAHIFNNYYSSKGNSYCIGVGSYGMALVENNYFKDVDRPHQFMYDVFCDITARGNIYENTTGARDTGRGGARAVSGQDFEVVPFDEAPYDYLLDKAEDVPGIVTRLAGPK